MDSIIHCFLAAQPHALIYQRGQQVVLLVANYKLKTNFFIAIRNTGDPQALPLKILNIKAKHWINA